MMEIKKCGCGRPIPNYEDECAMCFFGRFEKVEDPLEVVNQDYWQTSMGYSCSICHKNFLIGWKHKYNYRNYCECCKNASSFPKEDFKELVY